MQRDNRYDDDDDDAASGKAGKHKLTEFDCPGCNANNPCDPFGNGASVLCNYCGMSWEARIDDEGVLELREL